MDYRRSSMKIIPLVDPCQLLQQELMISGSLSSQQVDVANNDPLGPNQLFSWSLSATLVRCSKEFTPGAADSIAGPVYCLSNATHFLYLVAGYEDMSLLPLDCKVIPVSDGSSVLIQIPKYDNRELYENYKPQFFKESAERILSFTEMTVYLNEYNCMDCELHGARCAFSS
ncbi:hypothetical protein TRIUR3_33409 [Triticum urartu]|uniref:Uncharacterized protein n=1 Tax=Triticum urartu TaxID=4572 RepID=M7YSR7_TRIUA|nr:hypothetical protein TRIUR3_33409 [Triticum urartu]